MTVFRNVIIALLTAPELLFLAGIWAGLEMHPDAFSVVGSSLAGEADSWKYVPVVPVALLAWTTKTVVNIRSPLGQDANRRLYEWPLYTLLVGRLYLSLAISGIAAVSAVGLWLLGKPLRHDLIGAWFLAAYGSSLIVAATVTFAQAKLKEILTRYAG